ncbi:MAG: radical SAM protein [archaeon]|nr:MAG: radical SAM protein [archaeon]
MNKKIQKYEILMNFECNQRCIFCSVGHMFSRKKKIKTLNEIKKELDWAKDQSIGIISFSGGEPTIRRDLFECVGYAKKLGFEKIEIQSNGMMFYYKSYAKKMAESGANRFFISVHGNEKTHDFLTQVKGSFKKTIRGLENIQKTGVELRLGIVINNYNYMQLLEWTKNLLKFEALSYHFDYITPVGFSKENYKNLAPKIKEVAPSLKKSADFLLDSGFNPWIHNIYPCNLSGYEAMMSELMEKRTILSGSNFRADIDKTKKDGRKKPYSCEKCKFNSLCTGPYQKYIEIYGNKEFKPIRGELKSIEFQKYEN